MNRWVMMAGVDPAILGDLIYWLSEANSRTAQEQFNHAYQSGWVPAPGFTLDPLNYSLWYPGDPPMKPIAMTVLRDQKIFVYPYSWVAVVNKDGSFEVARMD